MVSSVGGSRSLLCLGKIPDVFSNANVGKRFNGRLAILRLVVVRKLRLDLW
jgi:hypothetical protein